jgi:hypothetical protein
MRRRRPPTRHGDLAGRRPRTPAPLPLVHGPGEQAMGVHRPRCALAVPLKRTVERTPAGPTPMNQ